MQYASDIIAEWPSAADFAADIGQSIGLVRVWKHRRSIPAEYWLAIEAAAKRREINVTVSDLARVAAAKLLPDSVAPSSVGGA